MAANQDNLTTFVRMSKARSAEHQQAMHVALTNGWLAVAGSVLRMELDSMIRAIYLIRHPAVRESILASCVAGTGFAPKPEKWISDNKMMQKADRALTEDAARAVAEDAVHINGWVEAVYKFGNTFVHLTNAHDYAVQDPFQAYPDRAAVIEYLNGYRYRAGNAELRPLDETATLQDLVRYAPYVLEKITDNLRIYLDELENQAVDQVVDFASGESS